MIRIRMNNQVIMYVVYIFTPASISTLRCGVFVLVKLHYIFVYTKKLGRQFHCLTVVIFIVPSPLDRLLTQTYLYP